MDAIGLCAQPTLDLGGKIHLGLVQRPPDRFGILQLAEYKQQNTNRILISFWCTSNPTV